MDQTVLVSNDWNDWSHSLCGCFDDVGACLLTCFCPCIAFGLNASDSGICCEGCCGTFWGCVLFFIPCVNICVWGCIRSNIRNKFRIAPNCCADCFTLMFCSCCALTQERQQCQTKQENLVVLQQAGVTVISQQPGAIVTQQPGVTVVQQSGPGLVQQPMNTQYVQPDKYQPQDGAGYPPQASVGYNPPPPPYNTGTMLPYAE